MISPHKKFWTAFSESSHAIRTLLIEGETKTAFKVVEALLASSGFEFCFALTMEQGQGVLTITPEGDPEIGREIDRMMLFRGDIPGWVIYSRRQRKPVDDAFEILKGIYGCEARDAVFSVRQVDGGWDVVMYTVAVDRFTQAEADGFIATFLEHVLGEEFVMTRIRTMHASAKFPNDGSYSAQELVRTLKV